MSAPAAPQNVLARNVGNGSVEIQWDQAAGAVSYNIYLSATSSSGPFYKANWAPIIGAVTRLPNLRFGLRVYCRVTAINAAGEESVQSATALDAVCGPGVVTLTFEGLVGDKIPAGAIFTAKVGAALVSFVTTTSGFIGAVSLVSPDGASLVSPDGATVVFAS